MKRSNASVSAPSTARAAIAATADRPWLSGTARGSSAIRQ
jgi:hypothetical protein